MRDLLCVGISVADTVTRPVSSMPAKGKLHLMESIGLYIGGCALLTSSAASRLGLKAGIATAVGRDAFGDFLLGRMRDEKLETAGVIRTPDHQTSATSVLVDGSGERSFLHVQGASAAISEKQAPDSLLRRYRALHVAGFYMMPRFDGPPARRVLGRALRRGLVTSLDTCWDPRRRWRLLLSCLPYVDYYLPSFEEAREVFKARDPERIAAAALKAGVRRAVVLKMGSKGCYALARGGRPLKVPAFRVRQVDATGAGDAFDAGFLAGILHKASLPKALELGCAAGALCVSGLGGLGGLESAAQARRLCVSGRRR